jgi:hypothetical protein
MTYQITADQLIEIADVFDNASNGRHADLRESLRADYSGRAMYGKQCLAFVGSARSLMLFAMAVVQVLSKEYDTAELMEELTRFSEDSMGREQVYYWTGGGIELDEDAEAELIS